MQIDLNQLIIKPCIRLRRPTTVTKKYWSV